MLRFHVKRSFSEEDHGLACTRAYGLQARIVIHVAGPPYYQYTPRQAKILLEETYRYAEMAAGRSQSILRLKSCLSSS